MKTVKMNVTHVYKPKPNVRIEYKAGNTYKRVPEYAVRSILAAKAGEIVKR